MNAIQDAARSDGAPRFGTRSSDLPVASRRGALNTLSSQLLGGEPPVLLLTGESGAGKSWLCRKLEAQLPSGWHSQVVEMTEGISPHEFLGLLRDGLGLALVEGAAASRIGLVRALDEEARDARSYLLIIENSQAAGDGVWAELLALIHSMESGRGYAGILLVGPTSLARRISGRERDAVASRIAAHVHLLPFDVAECRELLASGAAVEFRDPAMLERLHRDAAGNPRRILRLLSRQSLATAPAQSPVPEGGRLPGVAVPVERISPVASIAAPPRTPVAARPQPASVEVMAPAETGITAAAAMAGQLIPSRPPLRVEEGLVEVGWAGNLESESLASDVEVDGSPLGEPPVVEPSGPSGEEMVDDHYAALQAWNEWAVNRGRATVPDPEQARETEALPDPAEDEPSDEDSSSEDSAKRTLAGLRAEAQHEHAPYSQLFTRLRQSS